MVIMSGSTIAPPKRNKNASKKNKKSWRKNTDLDQVEEFLEDQRLEERLGGAFKERPDDSLFVEDTLPTPKQEVQEEETNPRLAKRKARAEKKLKCFSHIEPITEGCPDPLKQRPIAKTAEQRKAPWVKKREEERIKAGIRKWVQPDLLL